MHLSLPPTGGGQCPPYMVGHLYAFEPFLWHGRPARVLERSNR